MKTPKVRPTVLLAAVIGFMAFSSRLNAAAITVYPPVFSVEAGSTLQCTAYVPLSPNTVVWLVNGVAGGNASVGTVSSNGLFTPPRIIPTNNVVSVGARSTAYSSVIGTNVLTLTRKTPSLWSVSPSTLQVGSYQVSLNGSNFAADSVVLVNGVATPSTYVSSTSMTVKGTAAVGTATFSVRQPGPGSVTGNGISVPVVAAVVKVALSPTSATVRLSGTQQFTATVTGAANGAVSWSVNGIVGGNASVGIISTAGLYTAPSAMPTNSVVTVAAVSVPAPGSSAQCRVTLTLPPPPPVAVSISPTNAAVQYGTYRVFSATVLNTTNLGVIWSVNGTVGGSATVGTITATGVYTAPTAPPGSSTVTVQAQSVSSPASKASAVVTLTAPPPLQVWLAGARFLEQSSFGPTPATLAQVQQMGIDAFLKQQLNLPIRPIPIPPDNSMGSLQQWMLYNNTTAPDQLRQRVAYSLGQILVTSATKLVYADEMVPWLALLQTNAFGNYRNLLRAVSTCPSIGKYLDLANSMKPGMSGGANENFARELMQLFTIGIWQLNQDGSQWLDPTTQQPVPTYDQSTVSQVALALTGWTYPTVPGAAPQSANWEYFVGPMEPRTARHDTSAKSILGKGLPANQTPDQDLDGVLDILFHHSNLPPFIATRLIRSLVTSNPSPGYIRRVADVFSDNGNGMRGDLQAVVSAILLDPEARQDTPTLNGGRLKEPILHLSGFLRALNGSYSSTEGLTYLYDELAQMPLSPPSVFSWFSPLYHLPNSSLFGPEFQVYTGSEATLRGNLFFELLTNPGSDAFVDLTPFQPYGYDMPGLVEAANQAFLYGRMDPTMKSVLIQAASSGYDAATRVTTVLYLTALSGQYAVQY